MIKAAEESDPLPDIVGGQVIDELKRMKSERGMAVDGFQPKIWKVMPAECWNDTAELLNVAEHKVMFPT